MASLRAFYRAVHMLLTLRCDESTRLMSDAFERDLTGVERWAVRLHAIGCRHCRRIRRQFEWLQQLAQDRGAKASVLAAEARQRIRQNILSPDE